MAKQTEVKKGSEQSADLEQRFQKMRELYKDATPISKAALENVIRAVQSGEPATESVAQPTPPRPDRRSLRYG